MGGTVTEKDLVSHALLERDLDALFLSVLNYRDIIYRNASVTTLKPLDTVFHSALRFITGDSYSTHHCILYNKVGWPSLSLRRDDQFFFIICKALIGRLPPNLNSLLVCNTGAYHRLFNALGPSSLHGLRKDCL